MITSYMLKINFKKVLQVLPWFPHKIIDGKTDETDQSS